MTFMLAAALLLQDASAEEAFKKFEEKLEKSKTLSFKYRCEITSSRGEKNELIEASGTLLAKGGSQVLLETRALRGGKEFDKFSGKLVSDGKRAKAGSGRSWTTGDPPKDLRTLLGSMIVRSGVVMSLSIGLKADRAPDEPKAFLPDLRKLTELSDFKLGEGDGGAKTIRFKLKPTFDKEVGMDSTLHLDASGTKPLKRVIQFKAGREDATITETYEDFALDAEIPDEKFALPADK